MCEIFSPHHTIIQAIYIHENIKRERRGEREEEREREETERIPATYTIYVPSVSATRRRRQKWAMQMLKRGKGGIS